MLGKSLVKMKTKIIAEFFIYNFFSDTEHSDGILK